MMPGGFSCHKFAGKLVLRGGTVTTHPIDCTGSSMPDPDLPIALGNSIRWAAVRALVALTAETLSFGRTVVRVLTSYVLIQPPECCEQHANLIDQ
jgi:hypothetical protein